MECALERSNLWRDSRLSLDGSIFFRRHRNANGYDWKIYSVGDPELDEALVRLPELVLRKGCKRIKWESKIRVVCLPLRLGRRFKFVYVKQYNVLSFRHRLAAVFLASPAQRELAGAVALLQEGYTTARPIAAVEQRYWGVLIRSFYVSEEVAAAKTVAEYWRDLRPLRGNAAHLQRRTALKALAHLFRSLHERRIYHNDLKASNILALESAPKTDGTLALIDLQGLRKCCFLSRRRRIKNLAQLNRTLGADLSRTERLFFIKAYWGDQNSGRRERRQFLQTILKETSRQLIRERLRHPTAAIGPNDLEALAPWVCEEREFRSLAVG